MGRIHLEPVDACFMVKHMVLLRKCSLALKCIFRYDSESCMQGGFPTSVYIFKNMEFMHYVFTIFCSSSLLYCFQIYREDVSGVDSSAVVGLLFPNW